MAPGSLIGFFLVFVLVTWAGAAVATGSLWLAHARVRAWGPAAERRANALSMSLPVVVGGLVTGAVVLYSACPAFFGGVDHCGAHAHHDHLHLCLVHGGAWANEAWAVAASAAIGALFLVRGAQLAGALWTGHRRVQIIARSSRAVAAGNTPLFVGRADQDYCFATGYLRARIFVSSALWQRLGDDQKDAVLAHELAHVANRDLLTSLLLSVVAVVGAPMLATRARRGWAQATEKLCDRVAADQVGDGATVAEALLAWARGPERMSAGMSFLPNADAVEQRVKAVLDDHPTGQASARRIGWSAAAFVGSTAVAVVLLADPLHHLLELAFGLSTTLL